MAQNAMAEKLLVRAERKLIQRAYPQHIRLIQVGDRPLAFMTAIVLNAGGCAGLTNVIHTLAVRVTQQERKAPAEPVLQRELSGLVNRTSPAAVQHFKVQELWMGSKQVARLNRALAQQRA